MKELIQKYWKWIIAIGGIIALIAIILYFWNEKNKGKEEKKHGKE